MCGIVGIYSHRRVAEEIYNSLIYLQHRGQDAAGMLTSQARFDVKHGLGLVREVFKEKDIVAMQGNIGIGHTRYPTAGGYNLADVQPIWIGNPRGIALAHNGNVLNFKELTAEIMQKKYRHLNSSTDSEILLYLLSDALNFQIGSEEEDQTFFAGLCEAVQAVFNKAVGSYSIVGVILGKGLFAFRDPNGIRPLVMGKRVNPDQTIDYVIASETTMFYALGFQMIGDVQPGEVIFINNDGKLFRKIVQQKQFSPCIFEYVYFSRPDSTLNRVNVYRSRLKMGQNLAKRWKQLHPDLLPDVVIPVPATSKVAGLVFANELGVPYSEGLYKNQFIGRTFIMPDLQRRQQQVRYKLTPQESEIRGKKVLLLDDSIVRGTTSHEIVKMVREFEPKAVYFASACPPLKYPCYYGIDIPSADDLIAAKYSMEEIRQYLNVDQLIYQEADDLIDAVTSEGNHPIKTPCMACMNNQYVTGCVNQAEKLKLHQTREQNRGIVCES